MSISGEVASRSIDNVRCYPRRSCLRDLFVFESSCDFQSVSKVNTWTKAHWPGLNLERTDAAALGRQTLPNDVIHHDCE